MARLLNNLVCSFVILKFLSRVLETVPTMSMSNFWIVGHETGLCIHYLTNTSSTITRKKGEMIQIWSVLCCPPENANRYKNAEKWFYPCLTAYFFWHKQECKELMIHLFPQREVFSEDGRANCWKTNAETEAKLACSKGVSPTSQQTFIVLTYFHRKEKSNRIVTVTGLAHTHLNGNGRNLQNQWVQFPVIRSKFCSSKACPVLSEKLKSPTSVVRLAQSLNKD